MPRHPLPLLRGSMLLACFALAGTPLLAQEASEANKAKEASEKPSEDAFPVTAPELRQGRRFDPGATMTARAEGAPAQLDALVSYRGQWNVRRTAYNSEGMATHTALCLAEVTYVNRGHGFLEQLHCDDFDGLGNSLDTLALLAFSPTHDHWVWGEASSFTESAQMAHGPHASPLVLHDAQRRRGTPRMVFVRHTFRGLVDASPEDGADPAMEDSFEILTEESEYAPGDWQPVVARTYTRRKPREDFFAPASELGSAAPGRPPEAREFDFLLGRWNATHQLTPPNGQTLRWKSTSTAVYALNGHAVMEFDWFDTDPNLPDAATTILRIYNRAQRRWESLYLPNRGNNLLYFGGRKEGDRIVLYPFQADTATGPISRFVFHDFGQGTDKPASRDSYKWYSESSTDRGESFQKAWIIDVERQAP